MSKLLAQVEPLSAAKYVAFETLLDPQRMLGQQKHVLDWPYVEGWRMAPRLKALKVPGADAVGAHLEWIEGILEMSPDDCVKTLAGEGKSYLEARKRAAALEVLASDANLETLDTARRVLSEQWPVLAGHSPDPQLEETAKALQEALV